MTTALVASFVAGAASKLASHVQNRATGGLADLFIATRTCAIAVAVLSTDQISKGNLWTLDVVLALADMLVECRDLLDKLKEYDKVPDRKAEQAVLVDDAKKADPFRAEASRVIKRDLPRGATVVFEPRSVPVLR